MKNLSKKANVKNATSSKPMQNNPFAIFSKFKLNKPAQRGLKGGNDIIIVEDPIVG